MAARDYGAEYRARQERARSIGFKGYWQQRRSPRAIRSVADLAALPEPVRESRTDAFRVVHQARAERVAVESVARRLGVPMSTVRYWARDALRPRQGSSTMPTKGDRLLRLRPIVPRGENEVRFIPVRGSGAAARADDAFDLQWAFAHGDADPSELRVLDDMRVGGVSPESDPGRLRLVARAGGFDVATSYRELLGW